MDSFPSVAAEVLDCSHIRMWARLGARLRGAVPSGGQQQWSADDRRVTLEHPYSQQMSLTGDWAQQPLFPIASTAGCCVERLQEHGDALARALHKLRPRWWQAVGADVSHLLLVAGLSEAAEQLERAAAAAAPALPAAPRQARSEEQQEAAELAERVAFAQARLPQLQDLQRAAWLLERLRTEVTGASSIKDRMLLAAARLSMLSDFEPELGDEPQKHKAKSL
eukprot:scaffold3.g6428.t1